MQNNISLARDPTGSKIENQIHQEPDVGYHLEIKPKPGLGCKGVDRQVILVKFRKSNNRKQAY